MEKLDTEIRPEQLSQAALALIAAHGLEGLSIARVARRVGLVPSAIYRHYSGKDDLVDYAPALTSQQVKDEGKKHAQKQACREGKVKRKVLSLDRNVTRQATQLHKGEEIEVNEE